MILNTYIWQTRGIIHVYFKHWLFLTSAECSNDVTYLHYGLTSAPHLPGNNGSCGKPYYKRSICT